jgi:hypothetical protein
MARAQNCEDSLFSYTNPMRNSAMVVFVNGQQFPGFPELSLIAVAQRHDIFFFSLNPIYIPL